MKHGDTEATGTHGRIDMLEVGGSKPSPPNNPIDTIADIAFGVTA
jgi:hypothetical protein